MINFQIIFQNRMHYSFRGPRQRGQVHARMLFIGLLLSETQLIANFTQLTIYNIPLFTILYFITSSAFLLSLMIRYIFWLSSCGLALDVFELIIIPLSGTLMCFLLVNPGESMKIGCMCLLLVQSLLVMTKIIYLQSVTLQFAQITYFAKIFRILKLNIIFIVPFLFHTPLVRLAILSSLQLISALIVLFKFTYQQTNHEYILVAVTAAGLLSICDCVLQYIFSLPYLFMGQIMAVYFYCCEDYLVKQMVQLKYLNHLKSNSTKSQDDRLVDFNFILQCILPSRCSTSLSQRASNKALIYLSQMINNQAIPFPKSQCINNASTLQKFIRLAEEEKAEMLFEVMYAYFKKTASLACLQFIINNCLKLRGSYSYAYRALIIYYNNLQNKKDNYQIFANCLYPNLYHRILPFIHHHPAHHHQQASNILYFHFHDNLGQIKNLISGWIKKEIKLMQYLGQASKQNVQGLLFDRHELKGKISISIEKCFVVGIYKFSTEFLFVFILYELLLQKRMARTKILLKKYFLSNSISPTLHYCYQMSLALISATTTANAGDIINTNQIFKKQLGKTVESFNKKNISEFLPTENQRKKHLKVMMQGGERKVMSQHGQYDCLLLVLRQSSKLKMKVLERFSVTVRICHEYDYGFYYVCMFKRISHYSLNQFSMMQNDVSLYSQKSNALIPSEPFQATQLEDTFNICVVNIESKSLNYDDSLSLEAKKWEPEYQRKGMQFTTNLLEQKINRIQNKLDEEQLQKKGNMSVCNWLTIAIAALSVIYLLLAFSAVNKPIQAFQFTVLSQQKETISADRTIYQNLLMHLMLSFNLKSSHFPSSLCSKYGIPNITSYLIDIVNNKQQYPYDLQPFQFQNHKHGFQDLDFYQKLQLSPGFEMRFITLSFNYQKKMLLQRSAWNQQFSALIYNKTSAPLPLPYFYGFMVALFNTITVFNTSASLNYYLSPKIYQTSQQITRQLDVIDYLSAPIITFLFVLLLLIQLRRTHPLLSLLKTVEELPAEFLINKTQQLKYSLILFSKMEGNELQNVEINQQYVVCIKESTRQERMGLQYFFRWQMNRSEKVSYGAGAQEEDSLLEGSDQKQMSHKERAVQYSTLRRLLLYNRLYIIIVMLFMIATIQLAFNVVQEKREQFTAVLNFKSTQQSIMNFQANYHKLVAFNWLKVMSLYNSSESMSAANKMYEESISALVRNDLQANIEKAYQMQIKNNILYGNICMFFKNSSYCNHYRNGIFNYGLSTLLPLTVKEQVEIQAMPTNTTNSTDSFIFNLCDKTWILIEGVVPLTHQIPLYAYQQTMARLNSQQNVYYICMGTILVVFVMLMVAYLVAQSLKYSIVQQELLSIDFVQNLYSIKSYQPYLNRIYYS